MRRNQANFVAKATSIYGWKRDFARSQYKLWKEGVRDVRIHDNTFYIMEMLG